MAKLIAPSLAFIIVSSPETFRATHKVLGSWASSSEGIATPAGILVHMVVFLGLTYLFRMVLTMIAPQVSFKCGGNGCHYAPTAPEKCTCPSGFYYISTFDPGQRCVQN